MIAGALTVTAWPVSGSDTKPGALGVTFVVESAGQLEQIDHGALLGDPGVDAGVEGP